MKEGRPGKGPFKIEGGDTLRGGVLDSGLLGVLWDVLGVCFGVIVLSTVVGVSPVFCFCVLAVL